jgi:hypothetical protein
VAGVRVQDRLLRQGQPAIDGVMSREHIVVKPFRFGGGSGKLCRHPVVLGG